MTNEAEDTQDGLVYLVSPPQVDKTRVSPAVPLLERVRNESAYSVPWPGKTYIIVRRDNNQSLGLGMITPNIYYWSANSMGRMDHWMIEASEALGFLHLRNAATRMYVNIDSGESLCTQDDINPESGILFVKHPEGGYCVLSYNFRGHSLKTAGEFTKSGKVTQFRSLRVDFIEV